MQQYLNEPQQAQFPIEALQERVDIRDDEAYANGFLSLITKKIRSGSTILTRSFAISAASSSVMGTKPQFLNQDWS